VVAFVLLLKKPNNVHGQTRVEKQRFDSGENPMKKHLARCAFASAAVLCLSALVFTVASAQDTPEKPKSDITWEQAHVALKAAAKKAGEIGTKMDIAVVDAGANLKAFGRMDGAWLGSIDIAIKKAKTARFFDMNTGEIGKLSQPGGPLYNIEHSNGGLITFPGGIPIKNAAGEIIGAIGVSGSSVENDHTVAAAGVAALS
jgi:uncharacterized protein GlcG (DUF336 family)